MRDNIKNIHKLFKKHCLIEVSILHKNAIGFIFEKPRKDPLEKSEFIMSFTKPKDELGKRWRIYENMETSLGISLTAITHPQKTWAALTSEGYILTAANKCEWEEPDLAENKGIFSSIKSLKSGEAVAVSSRRGVYKRKDVGVWEKIGNGIDMASNESNENVGFSDVDSFSNEEVYAVGRNGDAWLYDGTNWKKIDVGTNLTLESIVCADNGNAYIDIEGKQIAIGRKDEWQILDYVFEKFIVSIVPYQDRVFVTTYSQIYEIKDNKVQVSDFGFPEMESYQLMDAKDGILVIGCNNAAYFYDGNDWAEIFDL